MSDEFDGLDATEKAGIGTALNRCRALATKIANELRNKRPEHFIDKLSLADVHASLSQRQKRGHSLRRSEDWPSAGLGGQRGPRRSLARAARSIREARLSRHRLNTLSDGSQRR